MIEHDELVVGMDVAVSDGQSEPVQGTQEHRVWKSRNFAGTVTSVGPDTVTLDVGDGVLLTVKCDGKCTFTPDTPTDSQMDAYYSKVVDRAAEQRLLHASMVINVWRDIKSLEAAQAANTVPTASAERWERWPFLMAIVEASGASLTATATTAKAELAPKVQKIARYSAKALLARRAIAQAATQAEKEAAADVDWDAA